MRKKYLADTDCRRPLDDGEYYLVDDAVNQEKSMRKTSTLSIKSGTTINRCVFCVFVHLCVCVCVTVLCVRECDAWYL